MFNVRVLSERFGENSTSNVENPAQVSGKGEQGGGSWPGRSTLREGARSFPWSNVCRDLRFSKVVTLTFWWKRNSLLLKQWAASNVVAGLQTKWISPHALNDMTTKQHSLNFPIICKIEEWVKHILINGCRWRVLDGGEKKKRIMCVLVNYFIFMCQLWSM